MDRKIKKKKWTARRVLGGLGVVSIASLILYVFVFRDQTKALRVYKEKISLADVNDGAFLEYIPTEGTVLPKQTIRLDAIVGGNVEQKYLEGGVEVQKGDTILRLANDAIQLSYINEQTQTNRLRNDIENTNNSLEQALFRSRNAIINLAFDIEEARDLHERNKKLWADKVISEVDYLATERRYRRLVASQENVLKQMRYDSINAITKVEQNKERLVTSEESLDIVKGRLNNLWVTASVSGLLSTVNVEVGQSISQGQNIAQIDDLEGFKVNARVDQHYLPRVYEGLRGTFDFDGGTYTLNIRKKFPEIINGQFVVEMVFEGEVPEKVRRGQTVTIRLQLSEERQAVMIPVGGFFQTTGGNWIFVLDETGSYATRRKIRIGNKNSRYYEVLEGLQPGERVVVSSYQGYEDKDKLIIL